MDLLSLFLFTRENNEIKSSTKINDFTVYLQLTHVALSVITTNENMWALFSLCLL